MRRIAVRPAALLAAALLVGGAGSGCAPRTESPPTAGAEDSGAAVTVSEQWVKAADAGMTGVFGTLNNSGTTDATVVSANSPAAGRVELHEVVGRPGSTTMQPKAGGFTIPAGGSHVLAPGGDHIMLMDLATPLQPGNDVEITLTLADGSTSTFTAQVREFAGAGENYQPGGQSAGDHG